MVGFYISLCFLAELLSEHLFFKYGVLNKRLRDIDFIFPCIFIVEERSSEGVSLWIWAVKQRSAMTVSWNVIFASKIVEASRTRRAQYMASSDSSTSSFFRKRSRFSFGVTGAEYDWFCFSNCARRLMILSRSRFFDFNHWDSISRITLYLYL